MATLEERVSYIEGRVEDHSRATGDLRDLVVALDQKVDRRFEVLEQKVDRRFEAVDRHCEALEQKFERRFTWVIGIQLSTLLTVVVGVLGIIGALVRR